MEILFSAILVLLVLSGCVGLVLFFFFKGSPGKTGTIIDDIKSGGKRK